MGGRSDNGVKRCKGCGVTITWIPVEREGNIYCCENCALGSPCLCRRLEADLLSSERSMVRDRGASKKG